MKIKDFEEVTIFFADKKQTLTFVKNGTSFKPCKHKYYTCYLTKQEIVQICQFLIEQEYIKLNELIK